MNSNEIQNDQMKASLINIETLQKEYEVLLQQYQEALQNYISSLEDTNKNTSFTSLKGRSWWGTSGIKEGEASTEEECQNMCLSSGDCSGATFNPVKHYCWTRKGNSLITAGLDDDYALIPRQIAALAVMTSLNNKLLDLNNQISNELINIKPQVEDQTNEKNIKQQQLNKSYQKMLEQKLEIEKQLQEYYSIEQDENNQYLYVNQQNITMRFWILIMCIILLITIKNLFGTENPPLSYTIWFFIIIILIILTYSLSTPSGFMLWFLFILFIVLTKSSN